MGGAFSRHGFSILGIKAVGHNLLPLVLGGGSGTI